MSRIVRKGYFAHLLSLSYLINYLQSETDKNSSFLLFIFTCQIILVCTFLRNSSLFACINTEKFLIYTKKGKILN